MSLSTVTPGLSHSPPGSGLTRSRSRSENPETRLRYPIPALAGDRGIVKCNYSMDYSFVLCNTFYEIFETWDLKSSLAEHEISFKHEKTDDKEYYTIH